MFLLLYTYRLELIYAKHRLHQFLNFLELSHIGYNFFIVFSNPNRLCLFFQTYQNVSGPLQFLWTELVMTTGFKK